MLAVMINTLGFRTKDLIRGPEALEIKGQAKTIHTTALPRSDRMLRKVLETWGNLLSPDSNKRPSANAATKTSQIVIW